MQHIIDLIVNNTETKVVAAISTFLGALLSWVIKGFRESKLGKAEIRQFRYFPPSKEDKHNEDFYKYFVRCLDAAKHVIYVSGAGFSCETLEGLKLAEEYQASTKSALRRGVRIVRVQTSRCISQGWADMLKDLLRSSQPTSFELYLLDQADQTESRSTTDVMSFCVIDPGLKSSVVEMMMSSNYIVGTNKTNIAGTAIFIEGAIDLSKQFKDNFINMIDHRSTVKISSSQEVDELIKANEIYFAYGSNMREKQMQVRVPSSQKRDVGYLDGYELDFKKKGTYRPGGVATIAPKKDARVYGVIWQVDRSDLQRLDRVEDPSAYRRRENEVITLSGERFSCYLYEPISQQESTIPPDKSYIDIIIGAAEENLLPEQYVKYLKSFSTTTSSNEAGHGSG